MRRIITELRRTTWPLLLEVSLFWGWPTGLVLLVAYDSNKVWVVVVVDRHFPVSIVCDVLVGIFSGSLASLINNILSLLSSSTKHTLFSLADRTCNPLPHGAAKVKPTGHGLILHREELDLIISHLEFPLQSLNCSLLLLNEFESRILVDHWYVANILSSACVVQSGYVLLQVLIEWSQAGKHQRERVASQRMTQQCSQLGLSIRHIGKVIRVQTTTPTRSAHSLSLLNATVLSQSSDDLPESKETFVDLYAFLDHLVIFALYSALSLTACQVN